MQSQAPLGPLPLGAHSLGQAEWLSVHSGSGRVLQTAPSCPLSTPGSYYAIKRETHLHLLRLLTCPSKERCGLGRTLRGPGRASRPTLMLLVPEGSEAALLNRLKWVYLSVSKSAWEPGHTPSRGLSPRRRASSTQGGGAINKTPKAIRGGGGMFYS